MSNVLPFKAVIAAARPELEQVALRVVIAGVVLAYAAWYVLRDGTVEPDGYKFLAVISGFLAFSVLLVLWLVAAPQVSVSRRLIGIIGDNAVATFALYQMGDGGAVILSVYLFITFGNGFRFGRFYLHVSQLLGIVGFSFVLVVSPFWSKHVGIGLGFLIGLIVLPFYVGILAERINAARVRAEEALAECVERERRRP